MKKNSSILITGGLGFIGSHLANHLSGHRLTLVSKSTPHSKFDIVPKTARVVKLNTNSSAFRQLVSKQKFDLIFHFAGTPHPTPSVTNPQADLKDNFLSTFKLLETIRSLKTKPKLVYASSVGVYGSCTDRHLSVKSSLPQPISPYGVSKLASEHYLRVYAQHYKLPTLSLRIFSTYGPGLTKQVVFDLIDKLHKNPKKLTVFGDGSQTRDLTYIDDQVFNITTIASKAKYNGQVANLGSGQGTSVNQLVRHLTTHLNINPKINYSGSLRPIDGQVWIADIKPAKKLGAKIYTPLVKGLKRTISWYQRTQAHPHVI